MRFLNPLSLLILSLFIVIVVASLHFPPGEAAPDLGRLCRSKAGRLVVGAAEVLRIPLSSLQTSVVDRYDDEGDPERVKVRHHMGVAYVTADKVLSTAVKVCQVTLINVC